MERKGRGKADEEELLKHVNELRGLSQQYLDHNATNGDHPPDQLIAVSSA
jgi:hypothetical protein